MRRGKPSMKMIASEKSRKRTFHKRKTSLMKKAYELSTLCDVRTCVLIHGPAQEDQSTVEVDTWPLNRSEIEDMIGAYRTNCLQKRSMKRFDLNDFFSDRKRKTETETSKLRNNAAEIKCPKWDERLEYLMEDQLRLLVDDLDSKIDVANRMIKFMEGDYDYLKGEGGASVMELGLQTESSSQNLCSNFNPELFEGQTPPICEENSTIETDQWPFLHYLLQTEEEAPQILATHNLLHMGNSVPMMPMDDDEIDLVLSNFLFASDGTQIQYNYEPPSFSNDLINGMITMDNNPNCHSAMPLQSALFPLSLQTSMN